MLLNSPEIQSEVVPKLIEEVAQLAQSDIVESDFYLELLGRLTSMIPVDGSCVWTVSENSFSALCVSGENLQKESQGEIDPAWEALLIDILQSSVTRIVLPQLANENQAVNTSPNMIALSPVVYAEKQYAVIELVFSPQVQVADHERIQQLLNVVSELAATFHRNQELNKLRAEQNWWLELNEFSQTVHASLNLNDVAYSIVNEGRRITECDRLTVFVSRGRRFRAQAISGLDSIQRRANSVRRLDELVALVLPIGEPFNYPCDIETLPPKVKAAVLACVDESNVRSLSVYPLMDLPDNEEQDQYLQQPKIVGGLVSEHFTAVPLDQNRLEKVAQHSLSAIKNVRVYRSIFLLPLWAAIGRMSWLVRLRTLPKTLAVLLLLTAATLALIFIPADFELTVEGTLQPADKRFVFAPENGVIDSLLVSHRTEVKTGTELFRLRSSEINLLLEEIEGELQTTIKKIAVIAASSADTLGNKITRAQANQMAAEEAELVTWRDSLIKQQNILKKRYENLTVRSQISGEVLTANLNELLAARPVTRGQILMTIADLKGAWVLELHLPDKRVGHLNAARESR